jgi:hypothetical protein
MAWVIGRRFGSLVSMAMLVSLDGAIDHAEGSETRESNVIIDNYLPLSTIGRQLALLPDELKERVLYSLLIGPIDADIRIPVTVDKGEGYGRYLRLLQSVDCQIFLLELPIDLKLSLLGAVPLVCIRSALRDLIGKWPQKLDHCRSDLWSNPTVLDIVLEHQGPSDNGSQNPADQDIRVWRRLFLCHSRDLISRRLIRPIIAHSFGVKSYEVPGVLYSAYGANVSDDTLGVLSDKDWSVYRQFYPHFPIFDYIMKYCRDKNPDELLNYITITASSHAHHALVILLRDKVLKEPYRGVPPVLPQSFFQALSGLLGNINNRSGSAEKIHTIGLFVHGTYFPAGINECADIITELTVSDLDAYTLPATVGKLGKLKKLTLQGRLDTLPHEITQLKSLVGIGCLTLPLLTRLEHSPDMEHFLVKQTCALSAGEYERLAGQKLIKKPSSFDRLKAAINFSRSTKKNKETMNVS